MTRDIEETGSTADHLTDDDLVLLHYGEPGEPGRPDAGAHSSKCEACAQRLEALGRILDAVVLPVPEPDRFLEARTWQAVSPRLASRSASAAPPRAAPWRSRRLGLAASLLVLVLAAYLAGKWQGRGEDSSIPADVRQRVLQVAVLDHLERGRHLLTDLLNTDGAMEEPGPPGPEASGHSSGGGAGAQAGGGGSGGTAPAADETADMEPLRRQAETLVAAGRIYRQSAAAAGQTALVAVLDDLERALLEVAHAPEPAGAAGQAALRERLRENGILLKVQMMATTLRGAPQQLRARPGRAGHRT